MAGTNWAALNFDESDGSEGDEPPAPIVKREPTSTADRVGELSILDGVVPRRLDAEKKDATKNPHVSRGISGADTLGLRQTEIANQAMGLRGSGTKAERIAALKKSTGLDQMVGGGADATVDDDWEDETGRVRTIAMRNFPDRGQPPHVPQGGFPPPANPLMPKLPLCYTSKGVPAPQYKHMNSSEFQAFQLAFAEEHCKTPDGKYELRMNETLDMGGLRHARAAGQKQTPRTARMCKAILEDRSYSAMEPIGLNLTKYGQKIVDQVDNGHYRFLRVSNGDNMQPSLLHTTSNSHITWPRMLGQHICTAWEHVPPALAAKTAAAAAAASGGGSGVNDVGAPTSSAFVASLAASEMGPPKPPVEDDIAKATALFGESSLLAGLEDDETFDDDDIEGRCELIRTRFAQFEEYLDRPAERRMCVSCKGPGADCLGTPLGDYMFNGVEWADPVCFCMTCKKCMVKRMAECDVGDQVDLQRCVGCWKPFGGFAVHNAATKKLMLMQAAKQVMLFCGPRGLDEPQENDQQNRARRACLKTIIEEGFGRALRVQTDVTASREARRVPVGGAQPLDSSSISNQRLP